jgi:Ca2+/Na+ antiporter
MSDLSINIRLNRKKRVKMDLQILSSAFENLALAKKTLEESMEFMLLTSTILNFFLFLGLSIIVIHTWQIQDLNYIMLFMAPLSMVKFFFMSWSSDREQKQVKCLSDN